ncbi:head-tail adaptor protein [Shewanella sp. MM_2022_3]|uniref:head-tail adaptor protein n=1 Tax=Shewanella sp. MM_2022_3 TaxID=2923280 RepID=UPI001F4C18BD|nr:head-tail adaptor protein [Shewanella sp. MM_2022_3]MCH7421465.1 head-tail adaptor protein [Shewanella sp. MM_2022_3]
MQAGKLNKLCEIFRATEIIDEIGQVQSELKSILTIYASVSKVQFDESTFDKVKKQLTRYVIHTRWNPLEILNTDVIVYNNIQLEILSVDNVNDANRELVIIAQSLK